MRKKISLTAFEDPGDPSVYVKIPVNCDKVDSFLKNYNNKNPNKKLSYTIIGIKSIGEIMKKSFSNKIAFGQLVPIKPKLAVLVDVDGKNLANLMIENFEKQTLPEIKEQLKGKISKFKNKKDKDFNY